jgi:hypothetical protein
MYVEKDWRKDMYDPLWEYGELLEERGKKRVRWGEKTTLIYTRIRGETRQTRQQW